MSKVVLMMKQALLLEFSALNEETSSALALRLLKEGFSQAEVAKVLRINRRTLSDHAKKWRIEGLLRATKKCVECGKEFKPKTSGLYCSDECRRKQIHSYSMSWLKNNRPLDRQRTNACRIRMRTMVISILGGRCVECGIDDYRCLNIDHVKGGGTKERKFLSERQFYSKVLESVVAGKHEYQLLCANHNAIKRYEQNEWKKPVYN